MRSNSRPSVPDSGPFSVGPWKVDLERRSLRRWRREVRLEPLALRLLVALAQRPGRVVSVRELRRRVWDDRHIDARTVARRVSELRLVLGDRGESPRYIATVPRQGYVLVAPVRRRDVRRRPGLAAAAALLVVVAILPWLDLGPQERSPSSSGLAERARAALELESSGDPREAAVELLEEAVGAAPESSRARVALTEAYALGALSKGSWAPWRDLAERAARPLPEAGSAAAPVERARGLAYSANFRVDDAIAAQSRALALDGRDPWARYRLAEARFHRGDLAEAVGLLRANHLREPESARWAYELAHLYGRLELAAARAWFHYAEERAPMDVRGQVQGALADLSAGRGEASRERMVRLLEAEPDCIPCLHVVAEVEVRTGAASGTLELLRLVSGRAPDPEAAFARLRLATVSAASRTELHRLATEWSGRLSAHDDTWFGPWLLARLEAASGHLEAALAQQALAVDRGYRDWRMDAEEPLFAPLSGDPRFERSLRRQREALRAQRDEVVRSGLAGDPEPTGGSEPGRDEVEELLVSPRPLDDLS